MQEYDILVRRSYRDARYLGVGETKEAALRDFVAEFHEISVDLIDYTKPIWLIDDGDHDLAGFVNGETKDDARAAFAKHAGFSSLKEFVAWEHKLDRELQIDRGVSADAVEARGDDEVESVDVALVEIFPIRSEDNGPRR